MTPRECPCFSGARYVACCKPYHVGDRSPETPEALMRSRFSAFALGLGTYLVDTLSAEHPERAHDPVMLARELSSMKARQRFLALRVLHTALLSSDAGEVLFHARVFERGVDRSFAELSLFHREEGCWRYLSGVLVPGSRIADPSSLTRDQLLLLASPPGCLSP